MMVRQQLGRSSRYSVLFLTTALASGLISPAVAQTIPAIPGPPIFSSIDDNGVNVVDGTFRPSQTLAAVGPKSGRLGHVYMGNFSESGVTSAINSASGSICGVGGCTPATMYKVSVDGESHIFAKPTMGNPTGAITTAYFNSRGQALSYDSTTQIYTHVDRQGTINTYAKALANTVGWTGNEAIITSRQFKNGEKWTYNYAGCGTGCNRLSSIVSSKGFMLKYDYTGSPQPNSSSFFTSVMALNRSVDYCNETAATCTYSKNWPRASVAYIGSAPITGMVITDELNRQTQYTISGGAITSITSPQGVQKTITYASGKVASVTESGVTWTYSYGTNYTRVTGPDGLYTQYTTDSATGDVSAIRNRAGSTTSKQSDTYGFTTKYTAPEGNAQEFVRGDGRANITQYKQIPKSGSGLATFVSTATFPTCSSASGDPLCNKPVSFTDARSQTTDFVYHASSGNLATITYPAPTSGAVRPEVRMTYSQVPTYEKNASGALIQAGTIWVLASKSACATLSTCAGTADETKTVYSYSGSNHAMPTSITEQSGDGALSRVQSFTYDALGNRTSVDGPLPGTVDTTVLRYNDGGQLIGTIGPDPDGAGALKHRATRYSHNADGQVIAIETAVLNSQSDADWAGFWPLERLAISYDANARKRTEEFIANGGTHTTTQYTYDALGRPECTIVRMNPLAFGALPANPTCTLHTEGSYGPDRISRTGYDEVGRVKTMEAAVGTADASVEVTNSYTANGQIATAKDAENNLTTYEYDGHDRLMKTRFPVGTQGANASSTTDYEQLSYDANSNVISRRLRDGQVINLAFDNLNRTTTKDVPNVALWEFDTSYAYDNLGRLTSASDTNTHTFSFGYDALGRKTSEGNSHFGTKTYQYDLAGRRTRTTWRDGLYVTYDYLVTGEMTAIKENGSVNLATFGYNDLGQRTSLVRGNGTATTYGYDYVSRLAALTQDLAGTAHDISLGFSYNPASQITGRTRSNDGYAFTQYVNVDRPYTVNGLNQYLTSGSVSLGYDGRGNLTSSGSNSYGYTSENRLATGPGTSLAYDPLGRLYFRGGWGDWFDYDGANLATEINSGSNQILRRYVHGPGADEPLVWYEGSGTTDRRWLHADERGSVIAVTDSAGAVINVNSYDEYGIPASTNLGRFQYTGQTWLPELGMYYYKARIYSPTLGRFMQTDPIGYGDGMNLYAYVAGDPINSADPMGLQEVPTSNGPRIIVTGNVCDMGMAWISSGYNGSCGYLPNIYITPGPSLGFMQQADSQPHGTQSVARHRGQRAKKISRCMRKWLSTHSLGYDWNRTVITDDAPMWGSDASTSLDTINVGSLYDSFESDKGLFFHEVSHMPQWASGSLNLPGYIGSAAYHFVRSGFDKSAAHASIPWEAEANGVRDFLADAYKQEGKPCG